MFIAGIWLVIAPITLPASQLSSNPMIQELNYAKKKRKASLSGSGTKSFKSCKEALRAGYSHMSRGQPGYTSNLDRDGTACDKVK